jgi:hypothetical protein
MTNKPVDAAIFQIKGGGYYKVTLTPLTSFTFAPDAITVRNAGGTGVIPRADYVPPPPPPPPPLHHLHRRPRRFRSLASSPGSSGHSRTLCIPHRRSGNTWAGPSQSAGSGRSVLR